MPDQSPRESSERERRLEEILAALLAAEDAGQPLVLEELLNQNADVADELRAFLGANDRVAALAAPLRAAVTGGGDALTTQRDPESARAVDICAQTTEIIAEASEKGSNSTDDP